MRGWAWGITLFAGLTMVSNVKYYSFKTINLKKSVPFIAIFAIVIFLALLSYQPAIVLFAGFVVYALSGYVGSAYMWLKRRRRRRRPRLTDRPPRPAPAAEAPRRAGEGPPPGAGPRPPRPLAAVKIAEVPP